MKCSNQIYIFFLRQLFSYFNVAVFSHACFYSRLCLGSAALPVQQQCMRENKEKQALGDLMIKPVQRIPRYELLVKVSDQRSHSASASRKTFFFLHMRRVCFIGPAQAHSTGPPGPRVPAGRPEGHQAIGREDQQGPSFSRGGGEGDQGHPGD